MTNLDRLTKDAHKCLLSLEAGGFEARLAGGCVRDRLMEVPPVDFDVATNAAPEQTTALFRRLGQKVVPTGIEHGTVTVVAPSGPIEITTLRRDIATDGRRAQVTFGHSFEEDAARRDFTINAMFEDARGQIYDYFGGLADLKAMRLRFVGDPSTRIREDYLRILRLFRFWSKLGFVPVPGTLDAVTAHQAGLSAISQERITSELLKTLAGDFAPGPMAALHESGVWHLILPELATSPSLHLSHLPGAFWPLAPEIPANRRGLGVLAAACVSEWSERNMALWTQLGTRLRLSRSDVKTLSWFPGLLERLRHLGSQRADMLLLAEECDHHGGRDSFETFYCPILEALAKVDHPESKAVLGSLREVLLTDSKWGHLRQNAPPVSGKEAMARLGLSQGPLLGEMLLALRRAYLNGEWNDKDAGLRLLERMKESQRPH